MTAGQFTVVDETSVLASNMVEEAEACQGGVQNHECRFLELGQLLQEPCSVC